MPGLFDPVELDGPRLKIRPLASAGWEAVAESLLYDGSWHERMWNITRPEDFRRMYERNLKGLDEKRGNPLVFLDRAEKEILGVTNFMNCEPANRLTEIGGTWISKKWQRTFVNTESKFLLLKYCFEELSLVRVEFRIDAENTASRKAIERLGVSYEGLLRNRRIVPSGDSRDYCFYSVIDREWARVRDHIQSLPGFLLG